MPGFPYHDKQANSKNCGPPPGSKFDLEVDQRSMSRSSHGINRKGLSQGSCMPNINALSLILQKIWARLKFLWQTDGRIDRQTDEWVLMFPTFAKGGGQLSTKAFQDFHGRFYKWIFLWHRELTAAMELLHVAIKSAYSTFSRVRWRDIACRWFKNWQRFIQGFYHIERTAFV